MYKRLLKPILDRIAAVLLLIVLSPLMLFAALLIVASMGRPVLFCQDRIGQNERRFKIFKFRTMRAQPATGPALSDAERLTGVGKWIRSLSIDELPQIFNIIKGDMSFIGPRPLLVQYLPRYNDVQRQRHHVQPGISGWAQVNGRNGISWQRRFELDVEYVNNISLWFDIKIAVLTVVKVLRRQGISNQNHATMEEFMGNDS